jgi:hypothetical protein
MPGMLVTTTAVATLLAGIAGPPPTVVVSRSAQCSAPLAPTSAPVSASASASSERAHASALAPACGGVRPGTAVFTPLTPQYPDSLSHCTFNFGWAGSDGNQYIGTAAHCILPADGEQVWPGNSGPVAMDGAKNPVGHWAWAARGNIDGHVTDLALVRLDPGVAFSAQLCQYMGPTGEFNGDLTFPQPMQLEMYGQGDGVGSVAPGRTLLALDSQQDQFDAYGAAVGGDSGSPVITADGLAVGEEVAIQVNTVNSSRGMTQGRGVIQVLRLPHQVRRASTAMGIRLTLSVVGQAQRRSAGVAHRTL